MTIQKLSIKGIVLGFVLLSVLMAVGCEQENANAVVASEEQKVLELTNQLEQKNKELDKLTKKNEEAEQVKSMLSDEIAYDQAFVQKVMAMLSEEEKQQIIQNEWQYSLQLDGVEIGQILQEQNKDKEQAVVKNQTVTIEKASFQLSLIEEKPAFLALPEDVLKTGKVEGNLSELITIEEEVKATNVEKEEKEKQALFEMSKVEENLNNGVTYQFKELKDNTTIKIKLTDELQKRLKLQSNMLTIQVKVVETTESTTESTTSSSSN